MTKRKFRRRNRLDVILTDSRPVELPQNYTLAYFYQFLNNNHELKGIFEKIRRELRASEKEKDGNIWGANWHSTPLKYHIYKNKYEIREMSLVSPLSMIEISIFIEAYEKQLLLMSSEDGFSVRNHVMNDKLEYLELINGNGIEYKYSAEKGLEASGNFYNIVPYKYIYRFHNSDLWYKYNREYKYFGKIDYNKCFDSIYTHTFTWLITKNSVDGKQYGKNQYFLNACDRILQNINGSITNGIVVGPEFSRIMVEVLAQHIDSRVKNTLFSEKYELNYDYVICRYVDDIFIFADEEKIVERIIEIYRDEAERFHFRLNDNKRILGKLPYVWFEWKEKVYRVNDYICQTLFTDKKTADYIIKYSPRKISNMKMLYQDLIASFPEYQAKITSYVLTTIYKRISTENKRSYFSDDKLICVLDYFLDSIFYFYSFTPSYNNTEKIISILDKVSHEIPTVIFEDCLRNVIKNYASILSKSNMEDIVDLILIISLYKIELPESVEEKLIAKVELCSNPIMYAILLIYSKHNIIKYDKTKKLIEERVKEAVLNMYSDKEFFMYSDTWWIYIFANCHMLSKECLELINDKLEKEKKFLEASKSNHIAKTAKLLVIKFLLDDSFPHKFINWDIGKDELYDLTVFTTYQRTLFNGYKERGNIEDYNDY